MKNLKVLGFLLAVQMLPFAAIAEQFQITHPDAISGFFENPSMYLNRHVPVTKGRLSKLPDAKKHLNSQVLAELLGMAHQGRIALLNAVVEIGVDNAKLTAMEQMLTLTFVYADKTKREFTLTKIELN